LYIADTTNSRIRKMDIHGNISTIAGTGTPGDTGDGGPAVNAELMSPAGLAVDSSGTLYIADFGSATVRKITPAGVIMPVAGIDQAGYDVFPGDGGPAYGATLGAPYSVAVDAAGNIYIGDLGSSSIREVGTNGIINTIVSQVAPGGLAIDAAGNLYIADYHNSVIDKVVPGGTAVPFAGNRIQGYAGNGGPASYAEFNLPYGIAVDASGNVYVSDYNNDVIRTLTPLSPSTVIVANGASNQRIVPPGANNSPLAVSPGELVTIFGEDGLGSPSGTQAQPDVNGLIETQLGSTIVTFNGIPGPVLATANNQVTVIVPYELAGASSATVNVLYNGQTTGSAIVPVGASAPGIFTLNSSAYTASGFTGSPVLNVDGTVNTVANAAAEASNITLYITGEGLTTPPSIDGLIAVGPTFTTPQLPVTVMINNEVAAIVSVGGVQGEVAGVTQVVVAIPSDVTTSSAVPVTVQVGNAVSPTVTIAVL
jgi:uncharacterized protein (TIGR03437 family)